MENERPHDGLVMQFAAPLALQKNKTKQNLRYYRIPLARSGKLICRMRRTLESDLVITLLPTDFHYTLHSHGPGFTIPIKQ